MARHVAAWNAHDMSALVVDTALDVVWVNVVGMRWDGREQVRRAHEVLHRTKFARSSLSEVSLDLRPVAEGAVIGISQTAIEGVGSTPDGRSYPAAGSIMTLLFRHAEGDWQIAHAHSTNIDARAAAHNPAKAAAGDEA